MEATPILAVCLAYVGWRCYGVDRLGAVCNGRDWSKSADVSGTVVHLLQVSGYVEDVT